MAITPDTLHRYFTQYGWEYQKTENPNVFLTGYEDDASHQPIAISLGDNVVAFTCPLIGISYASPMAQDLLRMNFAIPVAKISLDDELLITVSVETAADGFGYDEFAFALDALMQGVDQVKGVLKPQSVSTDKPANDGGL